MSSRKWLVQYFLYEHYIKSFCFNTLNIKSLIIRNNCLTLLLSRPIFFKAVLQKLQFSNVQMQF
jgi:hypothetical protein